jgi:hypothetical protein
MLRPMSARLQMLRGFLKRIDLAEMGSSTLDP